MHYVGYSIVFSSEEVKKMTNKTSEIEAFLKEISTANQTERKRLAMACSSLSQPGRSQTNVVEGSQNIRQRLLSLADRQKTLLQCFKTQKEVTDKLDMVLAQCKLQADSKPVGSVDSKKSQKKLDCGVVKPSSISAAIPNLLQHLKPQQLKDTPNQSQAHPPTSSQLATPNTTNTHQPNTYLPQNLVQMPQKIPPPSAPAGVQLHRIPATRLPPTALSTPHPQIPSQPQPPLVVSQAQVCSHNTMCPNLICIYTWLYKYHRQPFWELLPHWVVLQNIDWRGTVGFKLRTPRDPLFTNTYTCTYIVSLLPVILLLHAASIPGIGSASPTGDIDSAPLPGAWKGLPLVCPHGQLIPFLTQHCVTSYTVVIWPPCTNCLYSFEGCEFKCSLLESGILCSSTGGQYKTPNQWIGSCWTQLGQHKYSVKTKFAYKNVCSQNGCTLYCIHAYFLTRSDGFSEN